MSDLKINLSNGFCDFCAKRRNFPKLSKKGMIIKMKRIGEHTLQLSGRAYIEGYASVVGKREGSGPLAQYFDNIFEDTSLGEASWEKAESALQREAIKILFGKTGLSKPDINYIFAGDLLNQNIASTFGLRSFGIPVVEQFGACSAMAQTLGMASVFVDSGAANKCVAITSSHFCSAERQFRYPLEYGGIRPQTAQWTATASGAIAVGAKEDVQKKGDAKIRVEAVNFGCITDLGIKDANNMGAAMAPAAAQVLDSFFTDTETMPDDYDLIITGDLAKVGSDLLSRLMERNKKPLGSNYTDCGLLLFDRDAQDVHSGASGCGCSAAVMCAYILPNLESGKLKNVIFAGTGALLSSTSAQQGESIPCVAHLVHLVSEP